MPGPGGPRGGHGGGPGHGSGGMGHGPMGHGPGGMGRGPMGHRGGHMPPPPPHHYVYGHRPYRRGYGCSGCLMPVLGAIAVLVLIFAMIF